MTKTVTLSLSPKQAADEKYYLPIAARAAGTAPETIALVRILKRTVDARSRTPKVNLTLELYPEGEPLPPPVHFDWPEVSACPEVIVAGSGPAGLFAALRLIEEGFCPIVLERGREVSDRKRDIARLNRNESLDPDSNYAFGEGGAGTFSDGKLFTRSKKRGDCDKILRTLVYHGADPAILYEAHPHIGTDKLPGIITAIRKTIRSCGGEILFGRRVTDILLRGNKITGVCCGDERFEGAATILATGHSARDIYETLHRKGIALEAKPFAMGVRVEHPQELIDTIQYHDLRYREYLPAASYSLVAQVGGRGVYSFCMCPGGFIVPALTSPTESVVNGMSPSLRNSPWANSGIVVEVRLSDFEHLKAAYGPLAGMRFQQILEERARTESGPFQSAPAQRLTDFVTGRGSATLPRTSYLPGTVPSRMDRWIPSFIGETLREGFRIFGRRLHGFLSDEAQILGVESRTSTPVRIPRDASTLMHPCIEALFPAGEGAGYAGGIVSSAVDGERVASAVASYLHGVPTSIQ